MFKTLVKKEILNNLLNLRFVLGYFLCAFLIIGSATVMISDYVTEKKAYDISKGIYERRIKNATNIYDYMFTNKTIERPPAITRIFALGGEKDADPRASIAPEFSPYFYGDFKRNPLINLFPSVDIVFIIGIIISLLAFMLTYDSLSGEREEGTLKVLLSCPIPRDLILAAKWIGGFVSLIIPIVTSGLVVMLMLVFRKDISVRFDDWVKILLILVICILYIAVIFSLSMAISVLSKRSATGILSLLLVWVLWIITVPAISAPLAYHFVNPQGVWERQVSMSRIGIVGLNKQLDEGKDVWVKKFGRREYEELTQPEKEEAAQMSGAEIPYFVSVVDSMIKIGKDATRTDARIERLAQWIARISPYGCLQNACVTLAGTGISHDIALRQTAEDFATKSITYAYDVYKMQGTQARFDPTCGPSAIFQKESSLSVVQDSLIDISILILMGILFFMVAYLAFIRTELL